MISLWEQLFVLLCTTIWSDNKFKGLLCEEPAFTVSNMGVPLVAVRVSIKRFFWI